MSPEPEPQRKLGDRPDFDEWTADVMGALKSRGRSDGRNAREDGTADEASTPPSGERRGARLWRRLRGSRR